MIALPLRCSLVGMTLVLVCLWHPSPTHAAGSSLLAPSLYPRHTTITSIVPLLNGQMDCDWSFVC